MCACTRTTSGALLSSVNSSWIHPREEGKGIGTNLDKGCTGEKVKVVKVLMYLLVNFATSEC